MDMVEVVLKKSDSQAVVVASAQMNIEIQELKLIVRKHLDEPGIEVGIDIDAATNDSTIEN